MIVPTLHFTSCSSSVSFSDPLRFKSNTINANSLNSFGKPVANSTDNNNDYHNKPFETPSEVLYSENYFLRTNQNELTSNTLNPPKSINDTENNSIFLSNMDDFYKLKFDSDELLSNKNNFNKNINDDSSSNSSSASLSVIPILCQKSTNQIETNTFSFELKKPHSIDMKSLMKKKQESVNSLTFNKESSSNSDSKTIDEADKQEIIEYRNPRELLLMPSSYYQMPVKSKSDLHGQLLHEIQTKTNERSQKDLSMHLDEQGNLINNELNKLVSRNSISDSIQVNQPVECRFQMKSVQLDETNADSVTMSVNTVSSRKHAELENEKETTKQKSKLTLPSKIPIKLSSSIKTAESNKLNGNAMTMPATISNAVSRSMLSEAKFKLEAFSKMNKINNNNKSKTNQTTTKMTKTFENDFQTKF